MREFTRNRESNFEFVNKEAYKLSKPENIESSLAETQNEIYKIGFSVR
jgi:hypothetical protein